ncbi:MAG: hypothetical protein C3F12_11530 [Candidatus Methylomirabilota bacterium]|nr:MAG: hypothetical protein C3F12_11530 [candidate division NC10 bacterium]
MGTEMKQPNPTQQQLIAENQALRARLDEAEETLRAIRTGEADALVVSTAQGEQVFTLKGADHSYRLLIEQMNQGAATLTQDGLVLYGNRRLAEMVNASLEQVIGSSMHDWIAPADRGLFHGLLRGDETRRGVEIALRDGDDTLLPCYLDVNTARVDETQAVVCLTATDLTEQKAHAAQLRALALELITAEEGERQRVARLLHDSIQQRLAATKFRLNMVQSRLSDPALRRRIHEAVALLDASMEELRALTGQLSPLVLHELGLGAALAWLGRQMREQHGLAVAVRAAPGADPSSKETAALLFHAVRELLFNVVKHAEAAEARVILERTDEAVRVTVEDHGKGFEPATAAAPGASPGSFGLFTIRVRLEAIGGALTIDSAPGKGTRVSLLAPEALVAAIQ